MQTKRQKLNFSSFSLALFILVSTSACQHVVSKKTPKQENKLETLTLPSVNISQSIDKKAIDRNDYYSFANPKKIQVTHVSWDAEISFNKKVIFATASLDFKKKAKDNSILILDSRGLNIQSIHDQNGSALNYKMGPIDEHLGQSIHIFLAPLSKQVKIKYNTTEKSPSLQWLDPEQTLGKKHPFLFSQGQAILVRSLIPLQDSPAIRITYDAKLRVPSELTAVMSAHRLGEVKINDQLKEYSFEMPEKIPAYLIALAVGHLSFRELGPRSGVFAEPELVVTAEKEFSLVENMIQSVEKRYGKYRWGRFDILVLPPSFPFGGMENPRVTFLSPTVIAGDKSLTSVLAHELAHSWAGNLVTNQTWGDFWLNEGLTTYIERRIIEDLYGRDRADLLMALGRQELLDELKDFPKNSFKTALYQNPKYDDPDSGVNSVPYDKGSSFFVMLERYFGREKFDPFIKNYFDQHAFSNMSTQEFEQILKKQFTEQFPKFETETMLQTWLYKPGLASNLPSIDSQVLASINSQIQEVASIQTQDTNKRIIAEKKWIAQLNLNHPIEQMVFIQHLPRPISLSLLQELDKKYQFSKTKNALVRTEWLRLSIISGDQTIEASLREFLNSQSRRYITLPLYHHLMKTEWGAKLAQDIYNNVRPSYHPMTRRSADKIMKYKSE